MLRRIDRAPVALVLDVFSKLATPVTNRLEVFSGLASQVGLRCTNTYARNRLRLFQVGPTALFFGFFETASYSRGEDARESPYIHINQSRGGNVLPNACG